MNMGKTRFFYYGESELTDEVKEDIKEAGVRFVNKDSTTEGADRKCTESVRPMMGPPREI